MTNNNGLTNPEQLFADMQDAIAKNDNERIKQLTAEPKSETPPAVEATPTPTVETVVSEVQPPNAAPPLEETKPEGNSDISATKTADTPPPDPNAWIGSLSAEHQERVRGLMDDLKTERVKRRQAQQSYRSNAGRIASYQRTVTELTNRLNERPLNEDIAAKLESLEDFQQLAENDPKLAAFLKSRDDKIVKGLSEAFNKRLENVVNPLVEGHREEAQRDQQAFVLEQRALVKQLVPNVEEVVGHPLFAKWLEDSATPLQQKQAVSPYAEDGLTALDSYSKWLVTEGHYRPTPIPPPVQQAPVTTPNPEADRVAAARATKTAVPSSVAASSSSPVVSTPNAGGAVFDPEAYFNQVFKQEFEKLKRS